MKHFLWILESNLSQYLKGKSGVSANYVLPRDHINLDIQDLADASIWIVLRGKKGDAVFAMINVSTIEQFEDGHSAGDYLLSIDPTKSFRCIHDYLSAGNTFFQEHTKKYDLGFQEAERSLSDRLREHVFQRLVVKFQEPQKDQLRKTPAFVSRGSIETQARKAIEMIVMDFALEDLWAAKRETYFPPFANHAFYKIKKEFGQDHAQILAPFLIRFDPLSTSQPERLRHPESSVPFVDIEFQPIDPETIYARKFIAKSKSKVDLDETMEKIERAEKCHQDMLRDIVIQLKSFGFTPLHSSSVDLFIEIGDLCIVTEIKTSNITNIFNQSAKGCLQLGSYSYAVQNCGFKVQAACLILQKTLDSQINSHYSLIINSLGIRPFFYDAQMPWPKRLPGFVEFIRSSLSIGECDRKIQKNAPLEDFQNE